LKRALCNRRAIKPKKTGEIKGSLRRAVYPSATGSAVQAELAQRPLKTRSLTGAGPLPAPERGIPPRFRLKARVPESLFALAFAKGSSLLVRRLSRPPVLRPSSPALLVYAGALVFETGRVVASHPALSFLTPAPQNSRGTRDWRERPYS